MDPDPDPDLQLSSLMETSVKDLCVPVAVIVAESGRRGRRRRIARRLRIAGTALAVTAVALAGADLGLPLIEAGPRPGIAPAAPPAATASAHPSGPTPGRRGATPSGGPSKEADGAGGGTADGVAGPLQLPRLPTLGKPAPGVKIADQDLLEFTDSNVRQNLLEMNPGMGAVGLHSWPTHAGGIYLLLSDGKDRQGALELTLRRADRPFPTGSTLLSELQSQFRCGRDDAGDAGRQSMCTAGYLPDGSWEMVEANVNSAYGAYGYRVAVWRPSGLVVEFAEYCGTVDNRGVITGVKQKEPPVDLNTWRALTESPSWEYYRPLNAEEP
ncbi:hypothetical protein [Kitasatospora sp. NPDC057198]|uniref:hypothetical protein n=1 Tax=Kitasatospora sp. NPDC057198 TaxID=3346046 RepID=UPI0036393EAB